MYDPNILKLQQENLKKHLFITRQVNSLLKRLPLDFKLHRQLLRIQQDKYFIISDYIDHA